MEINQHYERENSEFWSKEKDNKIKECNIATCEYWSTPNNCRICEPECKHFTFGGCKLELERTCKQVDNCYFKKLGIAIEALKKIAYRDTTIRSNYFSSTVANEALEELRDMGLEIWSEKNEKL